MNIGFLICILVSLGLSANAAAGAYPFQVRGDQNGITTTLVASNAGPATISAKITAWGENLASDKTFPLFARIPPNSERVIGHLYPAGAGVSKMNWTTVFMLGDADAIHDPSALYRLPFRDGDMFTLGQSPGGIIVTHTDIESQNAVDIPMPEGAPIVAARAGKVIQIRSDSVKQGRSHEDKSEANFVEIQHEDGTIGVYAHMKTNGVLVFPGQQVHAGMEIGLAGSTGFSNGPHLHFAVQELKTGDPSGKGSAFHRVSVPFKFYVGNPPIPFSPREGMQVFAEYRQAVSPPTMGVFATAPAVQWQATDTQAKSTPYQVGGVHFAIPAPVAEFFRNLPLWAWLLGGALAFLCLVIAWPRPKLRAVRPWDGDR